MIRLLRVLEYTYETGEDMVRDMARWQIQGTRTFGGPTTISSSVVSSTEVPDAQAALVHALEELEAARRCVTVLGGDPVPAGQQSLQAAKDKVASLPPEYRAALEAEFQRAEQEGRDILNANTSRAGNSG